MGNLRHRGDAMRNRQKNQVIFLVFLLLLNFLLQEMLLYRSRASILKENTCMSSSFREQKLSQDLYEALQKASAKGEEFADLLTTTMLQGSFYPERISADSDPYVHFKSGEYAFLKKCYQAIWGDLEVFPIPDRNLTNATESFYYTDTFGSSRNLGGTRVHEGCDIFGQKNISGFYPVISMTAGTVEKVGWLPLGGYRIGIRGPHGGYFYYAHLSEYEKEFQEGDSVCAGEILGYMGNTGYGDEGTTGKFPVHLHLGIYIISPDNREVSVNPYYILQAMEKKLRKYAY